MECKIESKKQKSVSFARRRKPQHHRKAVNFLVQNTVTPIELYLSIILWSTLSTKSIKGQTTEEVFIRHIVFQYGLLGKLLSDNGTNFMSKLLNDMCKILQMHKKFTISYRPQDGGLCEQTNCKIGNPFAPFMHADQSDWNIYLLYATFAYKVQTSKHRPAKHHFSWTPAANLISALNAVLFDNKIRKDFILKEETVVILLILNLVMK